MPESIDKQLADARVALTNAKTDPALQAGLAPRGYAPDKLDEGLALLAAAEAAQNKVAQEAGEQVAATDALGTAWDAADDLYGPHVGFARVVFADDREARRSLALDGRRLQSTAGWIRQAGQFYANALATPRFQTALAEVGILEADLAAGQAAVAEVARLDNLQEDEKGDAQKATKDRDKALVPLDAYLDRFLGIARVVFRDDRQQLEKLGILARS